MSQAGCRICISGKEQRNNGRGGAGSEFLGRGNFWGRVRVSDLSFWGRWVREEKSRYRIWKNGGKQVKQAKQAGHKAQAEQIKTKEGPRLAKCPPLRATHEQRGWW